MHEGNATVDGAEKTKASVDMTARITTLYYDAVVKIVDYRCQCGRGHGDREEYASLHEIALVRRGLFVRRRGNEHDLLDPTRAMVLSPGDSYVIDHPRQGGDRCTVLLLADGYLREAAEAVGLASADHANRPVGPSVLQVGPQARLAHRLLLNAMAGGDGMLISERLLALLGLILQPHFFAAVAPSVAHRRLAHDAATLLAANSTGNITIDDVAGQLGVSVFHLCRVFRSVMGVTLHRQLTALRLAAALERLKDYENRLIDLALELGFSSHSHFTHAFRVEYGKTPSEWLASA